MTNKRFCSVITIIFFLFVIVVCSVGCDGDKRSDDNTPNPTPNYTFTVTFDSNGGSSVPSQKVEAGGTVIMPDNPAKDGYVFVGWFKDNVTFEDMFAFGTDGDKVTHDITLYAQWLEPNTLVAEYALSEVVIGYSKGDNPKYVTQNLTLPTKSGSADISWSSNSSAISANGTVMRQAGDVNVTLTARASYNGQTSEAKTFELKVIKKRTRDNSSIIAIGIDEASSGDIEITRNESGDITDVEGHYVSFDIQNADDALDAVTVLREELGIRSPNKELKVSMVTSDAYGAEYQFQQMYKGVKVFGRSLMASTNALGKGDFMHSSFLGSDVLDSANMKVNLTASEAEDKAKASYSGSVKVDTVRTELVVYSLESYDNAPVYAYVVRVYGMSGGDYIDDDVFVNADTGNVILRFTNMYHTRAKTVWQHGIDELSLDVQFPTTEYPIDGKTYLLMYDTMVLNPPVLVYSGDTTGSVVRHIYGEEWNDGQQISAYNNMREIMQWWKASFDRDSLDGRGMLVKVITHERVANETDNAFWNGGYEGIFICDINDTEKYDHSRAIGIDTLTHESTHAVIHYDVGYLPYENATGAINEGYADIFGCLKDRDWRHGWRTANDPRSYEIGITYFKDKTKCLRDARENITISSLSDGKYSTIDEIYSMYKTVTPDSKKNDNNGVHTYCRLITHAAYLMHKGNIPQYSLTWDDLAKVWYKSLRMGLSATSNFHDVRRCVIWAAMEIGFSDEKLAVIKEAFDEVGIQPQKEYFRTIYGTVTSGDSPVLENVRVTVSEKRVSRLFDNKLVSRVMGQKLTTAIGRYFFQLEAGYYHLSFDKEGYNPASSDVKLESSDNVELNIKLTKSNSIRGVVMSSTDKRPLPLVNVKLFAGNSATGTALRSTVTGDDGSYFFDLKTSPSGYYTLLFSKDGYKDATLLINVNGGIKAQAIYLSENEGIFGTVYISPDRTPLDGVTVKLWQGNNTSSLPLKTVTTDSSGKYSLSLKETGAGDYTITLAKTGYKSVTHNVSVPTGTTVWYNAYLEEEGEEEDIPIDEEHFPDKNFREYVKALDTDNSQTLSGQEIALVERINVSNKNISSLKGIEYFTALKYLDCSYNRLTEIEISKNKLLEQLLCSNNQLTEINLTANTMLKRLTCTNNMLKGLDVSSNIALINLECGSEVGSGYDTQEIMTLDLSKNTLLRSLICRKAGLSSLILGKNSVLENVDCQYNDIKVLDLSGCPKLNSSNVMYDSWVRVIYSSPSASYTEVLASLPVFTPEYTGIYTFNVSLDHEIPEDSSLLLLSDSEDLNGVFTCIEFPLNVNVSADFTAGRTYAPIIVAIHEDESQSGGCNVGTWSVMIFLAGMCFMKK